MQCIKPFSTIRGVCSFNVMNGLFCIDPPYNGVAWVVCGWFGSLAVYLFGRFGLNFVVWLVGWLICWLVVWLVSELVGLLV